MNLIVHPQKVTEIATLHMEKSCYSVANFFREFLRTHQELHGGCPSPRVQVSLDQNSLMLELIFSHFYRAVIFLDFLNFHFFLVWTFIFYTCKNTFTIFYA
jgi:hypothetical protein